MAVDLWQVTGRRPTNDVTQPLQFLNLQMTVSFLLRLMWTLSTIFWLHFSILLLISIFWNSRKKVRKRTRWKSKVKVEEGIEIVLPGIETLSWLGRFLLIKHGNDPAAFLNSHQGLYLLSALIRGKRDDPWLFPSFFFLVVVASYSLSRRLSRRRHPRQDDHPSINWSTTTI